MVGLAAAQDTEAVSLVGEEISRELLTFLGNDDNLSSVKAVY